jgi:hypothetical protein
MLIGNNTADYGPTFFTGINPPQDGYTIYINKTSNGPSIYCPTNETQLVTITNQISGNSFTTEDQCLNYFATQTDKIIVNRNYEGIVTDGLVLNLDAGFTPSYPKNGTTWYDVGGTNNGTLTNGPTFSSDNGGSVVFDGSSEYVSFGNSLNLQFENFTVGIWAKSPTNTPGANGFPIHVTNLIGKGNWNSNSHWKIGYKSSSSNPAKTISFSYGISWQTPAEVSVSTYDLSVWNYFVGVATPTQQLLYLNGQQVGSVNASKINVTNVEDFQIGRSSYIGRYFLGDISNAVIYNRALSATEVLQNYNATKGRFGL